MALRERWAVRRTTGAAERPRLKDRATDVGYAAGWGLVKALPERTASAAFARGADRAFRRNGAGTRQLRRNYRRVLGPKAGEAELDDLVRAGLQSYARYWKETFRLPSMDLRELIDVTGAGTEHVERLDDAVEQGRGVILALPHMGNWDISGAWFVDRYQKPFTTVNERLKPESLYNRFVAYREGLGFEILPATGGDRAPADVLKERLLAGGHLCLVADRDLSRSGVEVEFFGETAKMPAGPAVLAATTGAVLLPVAMWFTEDGWAQHIGTPVELPGERLKDRVRAGTQAMADQFAAQIAKHTVDWHMLQRFWLADLPPRKDPT